MNAQIKAFLVAVALTAPLACFAAPPVAHGNAGQHGKSGDHGNTGDRGNTDDQGNTGGHGNSGDHGAGGNGGQNGGYSGGQGHGIGRGNSQGAAHANYHAINAVCSHAVAAAHSALGIACGGGIVVREDPATGVRSYTQAGLDTAPASSTAIPAQPRQPRTKARPGPIGSVDGKPVDGLAGHPKDNKD